MALRTHAVTTMIVAAGLMALGAGQKAQAQVPFTIVTTSTFTNPLFGTESGDSTRPYFTVDLSSGNFMTATTLTPLNLNPLAGSSGPQSSTFSLLNFTVSVQLTDGANSGNFNIAGDFGPGVLTNVNNTAIFSNVHFTSPTVLTLGNDTFVASNLVAANATKAGGNSGAISFFVSSRNAVPEPGTVAMLAASTMTGLGLLARRRRK